MSMSTSAPGASRSNRTTARRRRRRRRRRGRLHGLRMNAGLKLGAYGLALVAVLGVGAASARPPARSTWRERQPRQRRPRDGRHDERDHRASAGGLLVAQDGYTSPPRTVSPMPASSRSRSSVPDGHPVTAYDDLHDRELHLIVASRTCGSTPTFTPSATPTVAGRWTFRRSRRRLPGVRRLPAGRRRAVHARRRPRRSRPPAHPASRCTARATDTVDGFDVTLDSDGSEVTITVRRDGDVITTEPYLGAAGHLVAIATAISPTSTSTRSTTSRPGRSASPSRSPPRARTPCSSTSRSTARSTPPASSSTSRPPAPPRRRRALRQR